MLVLKKAGHDRTKVQTRKQHLRLCTPLGVIHCGRTDGRQRVFRGYCAERETYKLKYICVQKNVMLYSKHILTPYAYINRIYTAHPDYQLCKAVISKVVLLRSFPSMFSVPRDQLVTSSLYWKMCIQQPVCIPRVAGVNLSQISIRCCTENLLAIALVASKSAWSPAV